MRNADMPTLLAPLYLSSFCSTSYFFLFLCYNFSLNFCSTCCSGMMSTICILFLQNMALTVIQTEQGKGEQGKEEVCPKYGKHWLIWQGWKSDRLSLLRDIRVLSWSMMSFSHFTPPLTFPLILSFNLLFHAQNVSYLWSNVSWRLMFQYLLLS